MMLSLYQIVVKLIVVTEDNKFKLLLVVVVFPQEIVIDAPFHMISPEDEEYY